MFALRSRARLSSLPLALTVLTVLHTKRRRAREESPQGVSCDDINSAGAVKGLLRRRQDELATVYKEFMAVTRSPGLVGCIIQNGEIVYFTANGTANMKSGTAVDRTTRFRIASMSKSFTAMAIVKLRDDGKLALDDKVSKYFKPGRDETMTPFDRLSIDSPDVTIRDLLTQISGLPQDDPWGDRLLDITESDLYSMAARR